MRIDVSAWRMFPLVDLFDMHNTNSIVQNLIDPGSGDVPYVTAQAGNNGVAARISCPDEWLNEGGCIMVGGKTMTFTYQPVPFVSNDSHNIALYARDGRARDVNCQMFLICVLRAALSSKYSWGDSVSMRSIRKDMVPLPVDGDGNPDWDFMSKFMEDMFTLSASTLDDLTRIRR